ncbi:MAG: hypothetical protein J7639_13785 [Paenibacillaceae bacterium]|nr:hypothetical protein [Paenibacillaceae bacterium]
MNHWSYAAAGVDVAAVVAPELAAEWIRELAEGDCRAWPIGTIVKGTGDVIVSGRIDWRDER